jgi:hypothetical protein
VWGTNFPARYYWNGGAFLRMDWLAASMIGLALLRRGRMVGAGFALTYGALLRIFPGFIVTGLLLKAGMRIWRERRLVLSREHKRFALGCIVALALLVPASAMITGSARSWVGFAENSAKHLKTPLTNNMGLRTVLSYVPAGRAKYTRNYGLEDPFEVWKAMRLRAFHHRRALFAFAILAFLLLLARAVEHEPDWVAAALGVGMIPVATELTCYYYYSFLLAFGLLYARREGLGALACLVSALTCLLPGLAVLVGWWDDDTFVWMSLMIVAFVSLAAWGMIRRNAGSADTAADERSRGLTTARG